MNSGSNDPGLSSAFYPVALKVDGRACLVVGAGGVAARKVSNLARCGAHVTVIAPKVCAEITELSSEQDGMEGVTRDHLVRIVRRRYRSGDVHGYRLVVTATGIQEVDRTVAEEAESAGIWVNSADDVRNSSFILPSILRDDPVCISVSTSGASPALATWLRDRIAEALGAGLGDLARFIQAARNEVKSSGDATFTIGWHDLLNGPLPQLLRDGELEAANRLIEGELGLSRTSPSRLSDHDDACAEEGDDDHY